jgi:RNA polymerase sigma factor (sigma-70 family)
MPPRHDTLRPAVSLDDAELYRRWAAGDRDAGEALIERHYDGILRFFRTKCGPMADDLVQRTFMVCADHERGFRGDSSFRTYLFAVARNVLYKFLRGRSVDQHVDPDFSVSSASALAPGPATFAAERAEYRLMVQALRTIPLDIQVTLELFYWEDMSVAELAQILEVPPGTVKSRLHRGRQLLREAMEQIAITPDEEASVRVLLDDWAARMQARVEG